MRETYSNYGAGERTRRAAKEAERKRNMTLGLIFIPVYMLGWFPLLWVIAKVFGR